MTKTFIKTCLLLSVLFVFTACPIQSGTKYPDGYYPTEPVNFTEINSEYDDINMDIPYLFENQLLIFATNRNSSGNNFDLICKPIEMTWSKNSGKFAYAQSMETDEIPIYTILSYSQSGANETGPYSFIQTEYSDKYNFKQYLFYNSDMDGKFKVRWYTYSMPESFQDRRFVSDSISMIRDIPFLCNPNFNQGYISFKMSPNHYKFYNPVENKIEKIIYCNDSLGHFDIFSTDIPEDIALDSFLINTTNVNKQNLSILNSPYNDRCPNVCGNFMVFSSDRPGGLGGYDFYYSTYENGSWSSPENFGAPINSPNDEYRAIAIYSPEFRNDLLIFSSNRAGGKGGFDIYFAGIDVMPEP